METRGCNETVFRARWLGELVQTRENLGVLPVRLALATLFLAHGGEKLLAWFGEPGSSATISFYRDVLGIPIFWILMGALTEFLSAAAILLGLFVRLAAFSLSADMLVGLFKVHLPNGFFINWSLAPNVGHGIEMNLAVLGLTLCLLIGGGGALSCDRRIAPKPS